VDFDWILIGFLSDFEWICVDDFEWICVDDFEWMMLSGF
jgi:hypothetical protein